jgi:hypothetical protein
MPAAPGRIDSRPVIGERSRRVAQGAGQPYRRDLERGVAVHGLAEGNAAREDEEARSEEVRINCRMGSISVFLML